jgi:hypothetical protein
MKKLFAVLTLVFILTSCYKDAQSSSYEGSGFNVEFLFEKDGVKVYRFRDGGHAHYFTNRGETMTQQSNGKSSYPENIE